MINKYLIYSLMNDKTRKNQAVLILIKSILLFSMESFKIVLHRNIIKNKEQNNNKYNMQIKFKHNISFLFIKLVYKSFKVF